MLSFSLIVILQLLAAQNNALMLNPTAVLGPGACQSEHTRNAVRTAVRDILSTVAFSLDLPCGSGPWTRVAYLNMTDPSQQCPPSWRLYNANGVRACGRPVTSTSGRCYSQNYTVQVSYRRVCGRITGYQIGSPNVFGDEQLPIDEPYVDGVSVTYGVPRKHIWTFAGGSSEKNVIHLRQLYCPCALNETEIRMQQPPAFVGNHYFCESGNPLNTFEDTNIFRYTNDPLWDGQNCEGQCCSNHNSPPWFSVTLPDVTSEKIEVRVCSDQEIGNEDTPIGLLEIYVQ